MNLNPAIFSKALQEHLDDDNIYGKIIISDNLYNEEQDEYSIAITLINDYMVKADTYFINRSLDNTEFVDSSEYEEIYRNYHPYFWEFTAVSTNPQLRRFILENVGSWIPINISNSVNRNNNYLSVEGTIVFGASPLICKKTTLIFSPVALSDPNIAKLNTLYSKSTLSSMTSKCVNNAITLDEFKSLFPDNTRYIIGTVNNVGQANNIELTFKDSQSKSCTMLYDVGCTTNIIDKTKPNIKRNINSFIHEKFNTIVLSHWDMDHIIGVEYYDSRILYSPNMIWVAPDINELSSAELTQGAFRLCCYISYKSKLYLSNNFYKSLNIKNSVFELWQGRGDVSSKEANHKNTIGLLVELKGFGKLTVDDMISVSSYTKFPRNISGLLTGDCPFDNIPKELKNRSYDLIVTPHHGTDTTVPDLCGTRNATAIVSASQTGLKHLYPGPNHILKLLQNGFSNILLTEIVSNINFILYT